jgi:hypothetical protein
MIVDLATVDKKPRKPKEGKVASAKKSLKKP